MNPKHIVQDLAKDLKDYYFCPEHWDKWRRNCKGCKGCKAAKDTRQLIIDLKGIVKDYPEGE